MTGYTTAVRHAIARLSAAPGLLGATADGTVYEGVAPEFARYPLVLVSPYLDPVDVLAGSGRVMTRVELAVRVFTRTPETDGGSIGAAAELYAMADRALNRTSGGTTDGRVIACVRTNETSSTRREDGHVIRSVGGRYRVDVTGLPA